MEAGAEELFTDVQPGSSDRRPQFKRLMELVERQQVGTVLVTRLDRLSRSRKTAFEALDLFTGTGVVLKSLDGSIDLSTVGGRTMAGLMVVLAQSEVEQLGERVKHGWRHLRQKGRAVNPPFSYTIVDEKYAINREPFLCVDGEELSRADCVRYLVDTFLARRTLRSTLRQFNEYFGLTFRPSYGMKGRIGRDMMRFSPGGLSSFLTNPVLAGDTCYLKKRGTKRLPRSQWQIIPDTHEALINREEERQILDILAANKRYRGWGTKAIRHPLAGLVYCGNCGAAHYSLKGGSKGSPRDYFQCSKWRERACDQKKTIEVTGLEKQVIDCLTARAKEVAAQVERFEPDRPESDKLRELRKSLSDIEGMPFNEGLELAKESLRAQIENELNHLLNESNLQEQMSTSMLPIFAQPDFYQTLDRQELRDILHLLVRKVVVQNGALVRVDLAV